MLQEDDVIGVLRSKNIAELKPLGDRVLVKVADAERASKGGVLLTDASADQPTLGTVWPVLRRCLLPRPCDLWTV